LDSFRRPLPPWASKMAAARGVSGVDHILQLQRPEFSRADKLSPALRRRLGITEREQRFMEANKKMGKNRARILYATDENVPAQLFLKANKKIGDEYTKLLGSPVIDLLAKKMKASSHSKDPAEALDKLSEHINTDGFNYIGASIVDPHDYWKGGHFYQRNKQTDGYGREILVDINAPPGEKVVVSSSRSHLNGWDENLIHGLIPEAKIKYLKTPPPTLANPHPVPPPPALPSLTTWSDLSPVGRLLSKKDMKITAKDLNELGEVAEMRVSGPPHFMFDGQLAPATFQHLVKGGVVRRHHHPPSDSKKKKKKKNKKRRSRTRVAKPFQLPRAQVPRINVLE